MSEGSWQDHVVGARMQVDQQFASRVADSRFTNPEWNLIMTATSFEIDGPEDPETARIVADVEAVEQILPELETVRRQLGPMGQPADRNRSGGGLIATVREALGLGGDEYEAEREAAETMTEEYARALQSHLEETGQWTQVCDIATGESTA